jgi:hypothetical protein
MNRIVSALLLTVTALVLFTSVAMVSADPFTTLLVPELGLMSVTSVYEEPFDRVDAWENYASSTGVALGVEQGVYRAYAPNPGYVWGLNAETHDDVVLEVDVTPMTIFGGNGAGVMCRADVSNNGNGYYFMITNDGYYSIRAGNDAGIAALVDWQRSDAIRTGIDTNTIRAVCVGDMLAMYVNDQFVAAVHDRTYTTGLAGMAISGGSTAADTVFDNMTLYGVSLGNSL